MTDLTIEVAQYTSARPSPTAASLLRDALLPQEPILAGLAGWDRLDQLFLLLTPLRVVVLRDGRREQRVIPIGFEECTGWEINPGWSSVSFHLGTHRGVVDVGRIDLTAGRQFAFAIDHQASVIGAAGMPADIALISEAFEALAGAVTAARNVGPAGEDAMQRDTATACLELLTPVVRSTGAVTLAMAYALNAWTCMSRPDAAKRGGGVNVRALLTAPTAPADVDAMTVFGQGSPRNRARTLRAAQDVVMAFRASVPVTAPAHQAQYSSLAQQLHERAAALEPAPVLAAAPIATSAGTPTVDVVAQLERLAGLRDSGAITAQEFADLKVKLLAAT